jgi:two-component system response regulator
MITERERSPLEVLLVEDSPTDVLMMQAALEDAMVANTLHVVEDGVQALAFLRQEGPYSAVPCPDLIILDLNLPRKNGREVLAEVKADAQLSLIPVVILTSSQAEDDVVKAYGHHANCYVAKPGDFTGFAKVVKAIEGFWFDVVILPPRDRHE